MSKQTVQIQMRWLLLAGFPQSLEIIENLENHKKKFHAWTNHGIYKNLNNHGKKSWNFVK